MKIKIKGESEDTIFKVRDFIQELQKVQNNYFNKLYEDLKKSDVAFEDTKLEDLLFDFVFNSDDSEQFEEYLEKVKAHEW